MAEAEERSHDASDRRLQSARDSGQAAISRELATAAGLGAATLVLTMAGPAVVDDVVRRLRAMLLMTQAPGGALLHAGGTLLAGLAPVVGAVAVAGAAAILLQSRFLLHAAAALPDLARLDPRRGLHRVFGATNAIEAAKAVAKLGVLAWAMWSVMSRLWPTLPSGLSLTPGGLVTEIGVDLIHLILLVFGLQLGLAVLDVGWVRWRFAERLKMSREELKQEHREAEGDPKVKARLRQLRLIRSKRRMMAAVAKATVIVTNPTHYAVALSYERGTQAAPRIVAKGVDEVAARIREAATRAGVAIVPNPPLARALYEVPLDAEIPAEHFRLVAEIIAYVWRLRGTVSR